MDRPRPGSRMGPVGGGHLSATDSGGFVCSRLVVTHNRTGRATHVLVG